MKAEVLMQEGCPVDLENHMGLYRDLHGYLDSIGQADGYWSDKGKELIPELFKRDNKLMEDMGEFFEEGYVPAATQAFISKFPQHDGEACNMAFDISNMVMMYSFEFAAGWVVSCVTSQGQPVWFVSGMLFPEYDGEAEAWMVFALLDEVFPVNEGPNAYIGKNAPTFLRDMLTDFADEHNGNLVDKGSKH